jgi:4'-phosphopantetheinyl transferase
MPVSSGRRFEILDGIDNEPPRSGCELAPAEATVWFAQPEKLASPEQRARLLALLSDDEERRLAGFVFEKDRQLFLTAHALLRLALSRCADVDPEAWRFRVGSNGRPEIEWPPTRLRFSLSHTRALAACVIAVDRDVGLDVEETATSGPLELGERVFSPREVNDLRLAPVALQRTRSYEYWTLKEAYLKARGLGLTLPLDSFSFYRDREGAWRIVIEKAIGDTPDRWSFASWRAGERHQAALAVSRPCASRDGVDGGKQHSSRAVARL